jgi:glycosyltransferase involved in cell wall biosynthesis
LPSHVDGIPDLIHDRINGLLVNPADSESLSDGIVELKNDGKLRGRLAARAKADAERYTPEQLAYRYITEIYRSLPRCDALGKRTGVSK